MKLKSKEIFLKIGTELQVSPTCGYEIREIYFHLINTPQEGNETLTVLGSKPDDTQTKIIKNTADLPVKIIGINQYFASYTKANPNCEYNSLGNIKVLNKGKI